MIESVVKEGIHEIYNISFNNKTKNKSLEKYKKTDLKVTLPYIQVLSEGLRRGFKKFNVNACFKNNHSLENLLIKRKDSDAIENLSLKRPRVRSKRREVRFISK